MQSMGRLMDRAIYRWLVDCDPSKGALSFLKKIYCPPHSFRREARCSMTREVTTVKGDGGSYGFGNQGDGGGDSDGDGEPVERVFRFGKHLTVLTAVKGGRERSRRDDMCRGEAE